jgi:hypothetical protein
MKWIKQEYAWKVSTHTQLYYIGTFRGNQREVLMPRYAKEDNV